MALIINFNSASYTQECIRSLRDGGVENIWVLDNQSRKDDIRLLRKAREILEFSLIESPDNSGFGGGINRLFREADPEDSEIIHIVNPDLVFQAGSIGLLEDSIVRNEFEIVSPEVHRVRRGKKVIWHSGGVLSTTTGRCIHIGSGKPPGYFSEKIYESSFLPAASISMRAKTFRTIGGFREDFFLYWEDSDFSIRARRLNISMACLRDATALHLVGRSSGNFEHKSHVFFYFIQRNRLLLFSGLGHKFNLVFGLGMPYTLFLLIWPLLQRTGRVKSLTGSLLGLAHGMARIVLVPDFLRKSLESGPE